jgi:hypothetical protein
MKIKIATLGLGLIAAFSLFAQTKEDERLAKIPPQ